MASLPQSEKKPSALALRLAALCNGPDDELDRDAALIEAEIAPLVDALDECVDALAMWSDTVQEQSPGFWVVKPLRHADYNEAASCAVHTIRTARAAVSCIVKGS